MCWHEWSNWEQYEQPMTMIRSGIKFTEIRQKRKCKKCDKVEDTLVY